MTGPAPHHEIPDPADRQALNTALANTGADTGFWDDHGRPAPWPDDIDQWAPTASGTTTSDPGQQPF
jgi:hypothetical protein